jgi:5'(3')-deoxyribonucleotidase
MNSQPIIGLDVDGVVANLVGPLLDQLHKRAGKRLFETDVTRFDLAAILGPELWPVARDVLREPGFASSLPAYPDALHGVDRLRSFGRVVFVTSPFPRSPTWAEDRSRWLRDHTSADRNDIVHLADKTLFAGRLLIDDSPMQLEAWVASGRPAVRMARPWNRDAPGNVARSWDELVQVVSDLLGT